MIFLIFYYAAKLITKIRVLLQDGHKPKNRKNPFSRLWSWTFSWTFIFVLF